MSCIGTGVCVQVLLQSSSVMTGMIGHALRSPLCKLGRGFRLDLGFALDTIFFRKGVVVRELNIMVSD